MFDYITLIYNSMVQFNKSVFLPLSNAFGLRELILLLFVCVLVIRFLLMPILGYKPFDVGLGSDVAQMSRRQQIGIEQKNLRIEQKG